MPRWLEDAENGLTDDFRVLLAELAEGRRLGDVQAFQRGRDFAASLGLTPRQHSTGGHDRLLGISKRGDSYLRTLLTHGARAVLRYSEGKEGNLSHWVRQLAERKHTNVAVIALANKTARIA